MYKYKCPPLCARHSDDLIGLSRRFVASGSAQQLLQPAGVSLDWVLRSGLALLLPLGVDPVWLGTQAAAQAVASSVATMLGRLLPAMAQLPLLLVLVLPPLLLVLVPSPRVAAETAAGLDTAEGFDLWAPTYNEDAVELGWLAPEQAAAQLAPLIPALAAQLAPAPLRALDAGCGSGLMAAAWRSLNLTRVTGMDLSAGMLEAARELEFYEALAHSSLDDPLPFADSQFDVIACVGNCLKLAEFQIKHLDKTCCNLFGIPDNPAMFSRTGVLSYVRETERRSVMSEFIRVAAPGGLIAFSHRTDYVEPQGWGGVQGQLAEEVLAPPISQRVSHGFLKDVR